VGTSIVHVGVGGFHRAHQAVYADDLLNQHGPSEWGICGVGLLTHDARIRDVLTSQDFLYTVVERSVHGDQARVIGSLRNFLFAPEDREGVIEKMASPECRILSLTITEGGYYINQGTGEFDEHHPDIQYDLAHHTVVFGPRYEALLREIFDGPELPPDFSLYLHAPTVSDPGLAPPGCGTHYVLSPVPHLGKANIDWVEEAPRYAKKIVRALERHLPNLSQHIVTQRWFTPLDFQHTLNAFQGSAFSIAPTLSQSAYFRPHNQDPKIPGLFIVGAGTHPGAGLPGVINSAKATVGLIAQQLSKEVAA